MSAMTNVVPLNSLRYGYCRDTILVKVDRQFTREQVIYPDGEDRAMKEFVSLELVVFDQWAGRMIVVMGTDEVMDSFYCTLSETHCYRISLFLVKRGGNGLRNDYHIELLPNTIVEDGPNTMPEHYFNLLTPSDVVGGVPKEWGLVDVCGVLRDVYPQTWCKVGRLVSKELTVELEGNDAINGWGVKKVFCKLHGEVAEATLRAYNELSNKERVFVVVQYAVGSITAFTGGAIVYSFCDATRVLFNPQDPKVRSIRNALIAGL